MLTPLEIVIICFAIICALTDILESKIYNVITFPVLLGGVIYHAVGIFYPEVSWASASIFGKYVGLGCLWALLWMVVYGFRIVAAGDVKFFLALYAWTGPPQILLLSSYILMASGVLALLYLIEDRKLIQFFRSSLYSFYSGVRIMTPDREYQRPLGFAMLLGTAAYILWK
jgi:prepilin peptidase CpaA